MQVFLSCVSEKADHRCKARDLYQSPLFKKSLEVAEKMHPDHIYILSAKHYLLELDDIIAPYNETLNDMNAEEKEKWAEKVLQKMKDKHVDFSAKTYFLAGENYTKNIIDKFSNSEVLYKGDGIGYILHNLDKKLNENLKNYIKSHMKSLNETLNEILSNINESFSAGDFDKVESFLKDDRKIKKFIKDNESNITFGKLSSNDIDNIINVFNKFQEDLKGQSSSDINIYFNDVKELLDDEDVYCDDDLIGGVRSLYIMLFKQITGKDLTTNKFYTSNINKCDMGRINNILKNSNKINKFLKQNNASSDVLNDLKYIYDKIEDSIDDEDLPYIVYDDIEWDDWEEDFEDLENSNALDLFKKLWQYANK